MIYGKKTESQTEMYNRTEKYKNLCLWVSVIDARPHSTWKLKDLIAATRFISIRWTNFFSVCDLLTADRKNIVTQEQNAQLSGDESLLEIEPKSFERVQLL